MDELVESADREVFVPLDAVLIEALTAQGDLGQRALDLLQDARRMLVEPEGWQRPYEVAVSCCRGAMDSLLKLSGIEPPGLKSAAGEALRRVEALLDEEASAGGWTDTQAPAAPDAGQGPEARAVVEAHLREACEVLRGELENPGGYHSRRVRRVAEQLTRRVLGAAEVSAASCWSDLYGRASGILHGGSITAREVGEIYQDLIAAVKQVFVSLPERSSRILELVALENPAAQEAQEVASWVDPRATEHFFRHATSPSWLALLPHVRMLPETDRWTAWVYLDRLCGSHPDLAADWLRSNLDDIQAKGPWATSMAMRLAERLGAVLAPEILSVTREDTNPAVLQGAAYWARAVPLQERTRDWILVVEHLVGQVGSDGLDDYEGGQLLVELLSTAHTYPHNTAPVANANVALIRVVCAGLLRRELDQTEHAAHALRWEEDLTALRVTDASAFFVRSLARAVLDLARAEAEAGVNLADRTQALKSKLQAGPVCDRLIAVHLLETLQTATGAEGSEHDASWWACALDIAPRTLSDMPRPDVGEFIAALVEHCHEALRADLDTVLATGLSTLPNDAELQAGWRQLEDTAQPPQEWRRVWAWSPLLPEGVLEPWQPLLERLEDFTGGPPHDPRERLTALGPWGEELPAFSLSDFALTAATDGPVATVQQIISWPATAPHPRQLRAYVPVIQQLVAIDPAAWVSDADGVITMLTDPELRSAYFEALQRAIHTDPTVPPTALTAAIHAAYSVLTTVPATPEVEEAREGMDRVRSSLFQLLQTAWARDTDLGDLEPTILDWLEDTTRTLEETAARAAATTETDPLNAAINHDGGRALLSLINWAASKARTTGSLPIRLIQLLDGALGTPQPDPRTYAILGTALTTLHVYAPEWVQTHADILLTIPPSGPAPARTWLQYGHPNRALLTTVDRTLLLACLQSGVPEGAAVHTAVALLQCPESLGQLEAFFDQLAAGPDGPAAVSRLFEHLAQALPKTTDAHTAFWPDHVVAIWHAAIAMTLPGESLTGAGRFSYATALDDALWLELTALTIQHTPLTDEAVAIAKRASRHAGSQDASAIMVSLLRHTSPVSWQLGRVQKHARQLLQDSAEKLPRESREALRRAMVESGDIEADALP